MFGTLIHSGGFGVEVTSVDLIDHFPSDSEVSINYDLSCPSASAVSSAFDQPHQIIQFARAEQRFGFKPNYKATPLLFVINMEDGDQADADRIAAEVNGLEGVYGYGGVYTGVDASCFSQSCMVEGFMDSTMYTEAEARDLLVSIAGETVDVYGGGDCDEDTGFMTVSRRETADLVSRLHSPHETSRRYGTSILSFHRRRQSYEHRPRILIQSTRHLPGVQSLALPRDC